MSKGYLQIERVLIGHSDPPTRQSIESAVREVTNGFVTIYQALSLPDVLEKAERLNPRVILLDLTDTRDLALDVAKSLRRTDRLIVGLYNPLVLGDEETTVLRDATRAGIGDFVPMPVAAAELKAAFDASPALHEPQHAQAKEGHLISFFSTKGGVGTTALAVNAALMAAAQGANGEVALCDANLQFGGVAGVLGLTPDQDISDLVKNLAAAGPIDSYVSTEKQTGLPVLPSPMDLEDAEGILPEDLSRVLIALRKRYDCVFVDVPNVLDLMTLSVLDLSERVYVVTEPSHPSVRHTARLLQLLEAQGFARNRLRIVLNGHSPFDTGVSAKVVAAELERPVDYVIPFEPKVRDALERNEPYIVGRGKSPFHKALAKLVEELPNAGRNR